MVVTLTGENSFGIGQALAQLADKFIAEHGDMALERVDCEEVDFGRIQESLSSLPFLATKKLIVLRSPDKQKRFLEEHEQLLGNLPKTTELIIVESKLDKRLSYYKYLKSKTVFREFPELDQNGLIKWLTDTAKDAGGSLSQSDARYLVERLGNNQQLAASELDKLLLYNPKITRDGVDLLTDPTPQSSIFQLLEAAFAGNSRRAVKLYAEQRAMKVEPQQIIAMLAWQLNILSIIKTAEDRNADDIAREARLSPFTVRKSQGIAGQLSVPELKNLVNDLLKIDINVKTTSIDADESLQHYLLKVASA